MQHFSWGLHLSDGSNLTSHDAYNRLTYQLNSELKSCECKLLSHNDFYEVLKTHDLSVICEILKKPFKWGKITNYVTRFIYFKSNVHCAASLNVNCLVDILQQLNKRVKMSQPTQPIEFMQELARVNDKLNVLAGEMDRLMQCISSQNRLLQDLTNALKTRQSYEEKENTIYK